MKCGRGFHRCGTATPPGFLALSGQTRGHDARRRVLGGDRCQSGMVFASALVSHEEAADGPIASQSGAVRSDWVDLPQRETNSMGSYLVYIFVCALSTAPGDCDNHSARNVVLGPEAHNEIMCGKEAQEMMATTAVKPKDGEYMKIACVRRRAVAEN